MKLITWCAGGREGGSRLSLQPKLQKVRWEGGFTGPQLLEGAGWERGEQIFSRVIAIVT